MLMVQNSVTSRALWLPQDVILRSLGCIHHLTSSHSTLPFENGVVPIGTCIFDPTTLKVW